MYSKKIFHKKTNKHLVLTKVFRNELILLHKNYFLNLKFC